jgi:hypothetical protein
MKTAILFLLLIPLLICLSLSHIAQAVSPPPDGNYGAGNTAEGGTATLFSLTTGGNNTALGSEALFSVTTGKQNTATGSQALKNNTADNNTADGFQALNQNTNGSNNTATGWRALVQNRAGENNTANGVQTLARNIAGNGNTAMGFQALFSNTTGSQNAAVGEDALSGNTTGHDNIALGYGCGGNITTGSSNIDIGNRGMNGDERTIRIGTAQTDTFIAGIFGRNIVGLPVAVDSGGHLGVGVASSARFKDQVEPMDKASQAILALRPVTFYYKQEIDPKRTPQFGLVAEEVEKISPDLVTRDANGEPYTVRYEAVNAMLLNEFLKARRQIDAQQKQIEALATSLHKVSAELELNKRAQQTVLNNQ